MYSMAVVVFGLGNSDLQYLNTKHNAGRIVMDIMVKKLGISYKKKPRYFFAKHETLSDLYFVYSNGFMNVSGDSLSEYLKYFELDNESTKVLVFQDDSDIVEVNQKLSKGGRSAGHKGIDSIYKSLLNSNISLENIWRLKLGIRPKDFIGKSSKFVLAKINQVELSHYSFLADYLLSKIDLIAHGEFEILQKRFK
ncbi:MAG: hypothetical protein HC932_01300 [Thermales bacterium]|nr:hypothetical protein [Thermales bacterium]